MGSAYVARRIDAPSDTVWDLMSWRGMAKLAGHGHFLAVEFEGEGDGPGSVKHITILTGHEVRERLEWVDEVAKAYSYRILDTGALGVASYEAVVRITAMGPRACGVVIDCRFVAIGMSEREYIDLWVTMENELLAQIASTAEQAG